MSRGVLQNVVGELRPNEVQAYLESRAWHREWAVGDRAAYWVKGNHEVLVPLIRGIRDYSLRMDDVIAVLEVAEDKAADQLIGEITAPVSDLVQLRLEEPTSAHGNIRLEAGLDLVRGARDLIASAAASTAERRGFYGVQRPRQADAYLRNVRLGPARAGSYTISVIAPLDLLDDEHRVQSFGRRVTQTLARGLGAIDAWTETRSWQDQGLPDLIRAGVSADMCGALADAVGGEPERSLTIAFTWSASRPRSRDLPDRLEITSEVHGALEELGNTLSGGQLRAVTEYDLGYAERRVEVEAPMIRDVTVTGHVATLSRRSWILVIGKVEGRERSVRIDLSDSEYELAITAHQRGLQVSCSGDLIDRPRIPRLVNTRDFKILGA